MKQVQGLPDKVRDQVFEVVYKMADEHKYLAKGRVENGTFMNQLVKHPQVGEQLAEYMAKGHIKTYIKDTILNRYAKVRRSLPQDVDEILSQHYPTKIHEIEYVQADHLSLHRTNQNKYLVVARVNYLKWETAIRKIALYVASKSDSQLNELDLDLVTIIFEQGCPVNTADRDLVSRGLKLLGIKTIWWE